MFSVISIDSATLLWYGHRAHSLQHNAHLETEKFGLENLIFGPQISFETAQIRRTPGLQMLSSNSNLETEKQRRGVNLTPNWTGFY